MLVWRSVSHDDVDAIWNWLRCDGCLLQRCLLGGVEVVFVDVVHEGVVSEFGRIWGRVDAERDAVAEGEVVASLCEIGDTRYTAISS